MRFDGVYVNIGVQRMKNVIEILLDEQFWKGK